MHLLKNLSKMVAEAYSVILFLGDSPMEIRLTKVQRQPETCVLRAVLWLQTEAAQIKSAGLVNSRAMSAYPK